MIKKKVFIHGASGQAKVVLDILEQIGGYEVTHFFDNDNSKTELRGIPVLHEYNNAFEDFRSWDAKNDGKVLGRDYFFVVAIGADNKKRYDLFKMYRQAGYKPLNVIHPKAIIEPSARLGEGVQIMAGATICADVIVGNAVIINTGAGIDHESIIEDGVHIMPQATLAGWVNIKKYANIGSNATVFPRKNIGEGAFLGAGAVAVKDVPANEAWVGNPAIFFKTMVDYNFYKHKQH